MTETGQIAAESVQKLAGNMLCQIENCTNPAKVCPVLVFPKITPTGRFTPANSRRQKELANRANIALPICGECRKKLTVNDFLNTATIEYFRNWHGQRMLPIPPVSCITLDWQPYQEVLAKHIEAHKTDSKPEPNTPEPAIQGDNNGH